MSAFCKRRRFAIPDKVWKVVEPLSGFLSNKEAGLLYWAAVHWPVAGPVLELGSYAGRSTIVFARAGRHVHAIDAWSLNVADLSAYGGGETDANSVLESFKHNLEQAGVAAKVDIHRGLTQHVGRTWTIPGAILFIDAGHTYEDVKGDLDIWTQHLLPEGLLLMHDVLGDTYLGVTRAASDLLNQNWRVIVSAGSIVGFARTRAAPPAPGQHGNRLAR